MDKKFLIALNEKIDMPAEAKNQIYDTFDIILKDNDFKQKYDKINCDFFDSGDVLKRIHDLAAIKNIHPDLLTLVFLEMFSENTLKLYGSSDLDLTEHIFYHTMEDFTIWVNVCKRDYGHWGIKEYYWLQKHLRAELYHLGRMQYHYIKFNKDSYSNKYINVKRDDTVINIHIPEGHSFDRATRLESYRIAYKLLKCNIFVCDSWLLYPKHRDFLPRYSNILNFMDDFNIFDSHESTDMSNMWRIFNRRETYIPSELPRNTGLQRAYADWLAAEGVTGSGYGIFYFDGENILK